MVLRPSPLRLFSTAGPSQLDAPTATHRIRRRASPTPPPTHRLRPTPTDANDHGPPANQFAAAAVTTPVASDAAPRRHRRRRTASDRRQRPRPSCQSICSSSRHNSPSHPTSRLADIVAESVQAYLTHVLSTRPQTVPTLSIGPISWDTPAGHSLRDDHRYYRRWPSTAC